MIELPILSFILLLSVGGLLCMCIGATISFILEHGIFDKNRTSSTQTDPVETVEHGVQVDRIIAESAELVHPFPELERIVPIHIQYPRNIVQSSGSQTTYSYTSTSSSQTPSPIILTKEVQTFIPIVSDGTQTPPSLATSSMESQTNSVFVSDSLPSQLQERDAIIRNLEVELCRTNSVIKEHSVERMKIYTMLQLEGTYTINFSSPDGAIETGTLVSTQTLTKWMAEKEALARNIEWHEFELSKYKNHVNELKKSVDEMKTWGISHRTYWEKIKEEIRKKEHNVKEFKKHKKHIIHDCKEALYCAEELADNIPFYSAHKTKEAVRTVRTLRKLSCVYDISTADQSSSSEEDLVDECLLDYIGTPPYTPTMLVGANLTDVTCAYVKEPSAPPLAIN